jgi:hypothetical protein
MQPTTHQEDMMQAYSDESRASDPHALPDLEIFQMTAREIAERNEDLIHEYLTRHEFRLASMNSRTREAMFDAMIEEEGIQGGWFYWYCFPGCMPDSDPIGPYDSSKEAKQAAQDEAGDY